MQLTRVDLPEPFGPIRPEPLARLHLEVDAVQRDEAAEALAEPVDLQQRASSPFLWNRPTMPCGATITKATISTPATSTLTAEEMVTVTIFLQAAHQHRADHRARASSPVPPISGMAMAFTA